MSLIEEVCYNQPQCRQTLYDMEDSSKIIVAVNEWIPQLNEVYENTGYFHIAGSLVALFRGMMEG